MINTLFLPELREMLASGASDELTEFCTALHPARTAEYMEGLSPSESWQVLRHADEALRGQIFSYLPHQRQVEILAKEDPGEVAFLIAQLPADDRVDLLQELPDKKRAEEILWRLSPADRRDILRLQSYPEGTAGALMTTQMAKLGEKLTVRQALDELSKQSAELETIYYIYVVDDEDRLRGIVSGRDLISALGKHDVRLADLMETDFIAATTDEDQESVAEKVERYDLLAIPVIDPGRMLVGIITHDDVIDVVREELVEDAYRIAAMEPLEEGYLRTSILMLSWKRGLWLTILFFTALLTAFALERYEDQISSYRWLVLFVPLVISSGGNSGSQSATLIITAMTNGDVKTTDWPQIVFRELLQGLLLGSFLACCGIAAAFFLAPSLSDAMVIPITLLLVVLAGTLCGSVLPLLFKRLGLDPAIMSNPFVAGIIDILGILIYLNVAQLVLG